MIKKTIRIGILITIITFIISIEAFSAFERESMDDVSNAVSPNIVDSLETEGETTAHPGTSQSQDGTLTTTPTTVTAENTPSTGGGIAGALAGVINVIPNLANKSITYLVNSQQEVSTGKDFTIQSLVFQKYDMFDINFFNNINHSGKFSGDVAKNVYLWYSILRKIAIIISLCMLVYVGIRMAISTLAEDKAKYKKMLINWVVSFCLLFIMHYIVIIAMNMADGIIEFLPEPSENIEDTIMNGKGSDDGILDQVEKKKGWNLVTVSILYWIMVYYQVKFFIMYVRRMLSTGLLLILSPFLTVTYVIDKMGDDKAQAYKNWAKEIMVNIFIQPLHASLYLVFITSAGEIAVVAPLFAAIFFAALSRGEKIIKNIFNMRGLTSMNSLGSINIVPKK